MGAATITLQGQRSLGTGANSEIGEAVVQGLTAAGGRVVINYVLHPEAADKIAADITAAGGEAFTVLADVSRINLFGAFLCAQQALKRMVPQQGGVALNITSVHDKIAWSGYSVYAASQDGEDIADEDAGSASRPAPGPGAGSRRGSHADQAVWSSPTPLADLLIKIQLGRMGETSDTANMVVFLCSAQASDMTGTTVYVDGAMTDDPEFAHGG